MPVRPVAAGRAAGTLAKAGLGGKGTALLPNSTHRRAAAIGLRHDIKARLLQQIETVDRRPGKRDAGRRYMAARQIARRCPRGVL